MEKTETYNKWITDNIKNNGLGQCAKATEIMNNDFPELVRVRGHYNCPIWGLREHWWLTTPEGNIIDPTARQFPSKGFGDYTPWDESREEPTGTCPNCGGYAYNGNTTCSEKCFKEYKTYLESLT